MLNVGIHLDDQDPANGGLRLLPGTRQQNLWNMLFRKKNFLDNSRCTRSGVQHQSRRPYRA